MAQHLPSFSDLMTSFHAGLFQGRNNSNMVEIVISLQRRIRSMYLNNAPNELQQRLVASLLDPALEAVFPQRPNPDLVYPDSTAGEVQRKRAQEVNALADCFTRIISAMKHTIHRFVPIDIQDRLEIEGTLDRQTVHGILAILTTRYAADVALNQRTYLQQLQAPFNPRTHSIDAYMSFVRHTRATLHLLGQALTDDLFVEMICASIMAGDPQYAATIDSYLNTSADRSLDRLDRVLINRAATLALSAANTAIAVAPAAANALLPVSSGPSAPNTKSKSRDKAARSGKGGNGVGDQNGARVRPNTKDIGKLARQLQQHLHIQASTYPYDTRHGPRPPPPRGHANLASGSFLPPMPTPPAYPNHWPPAYQDNPYPGPPGPYWSPDDV